MKRLFATVLLFSLFGGQVVAAEQPKPASKPNVVYIMADDVGWGDISLHGGGVQTPRIDRLFNEGVRFNNFMAWCVCSPTRAMLLTGRHPFRVGTGPNTGGELALEETTIAEGFKAHGYRTGVFGKWHNGADPGTPEFQAAFFEAFKDMPNKKHSGGYGANAHGFDEAWIYYGGGENYFNRRTVQGRGPVSWWHNNEFRPNDEGYTDDLVTQRAIEFIRENKDRPFFCYIPFHIAHAPLQAKDDDLAAIDPKMAADLPTASGKTTPENKHIHAAMLHSMDKNVEMIRAELDKLGLSENTILVFTSDNGAMEAGSSLPLRGHKHTIYEGGVRMPSVIYWPKGGLIGGRKWEGLCGALDMFPTLMAMAGLEMPETRPLDGKNVWPALRDNTASPVDSYYWAWRNEDSIRTADWKLHRFSDRFELYDVHKDECETTNVADTNPDVLKSLSVKMDAWVESLGAALTHRSPPAKLDAKPSPEGEVLEIKVTVTDQAKPRDTLIVPIAGAEIRQFATDYVEFDIATSLDTPRQGNWFYSPFKGNNASDFVVFFKKGEGVDQFGREQSSLVEMQGGPGAWEHRIIGLCTYAPGAMPRHGIVFRGGRPGTYTIYLDNIRMRHADGSTSPIWTGSNDASSKSLRAPKIENAELFRDVSVRIVTEFPSGTQKVSP